MAWYIPKRQKFETCEKFEQVRNKSKEYAKNEEKARDFRARMISVSREQKLTEQQKRRLQELEELER